MERKGGTDEQMNLLLKDLVMRLPFAFFLGERQHDQSEQDVLFRRSTVSTARPTNGTSTRPSRRRLGKCCEARMGERCSAEGGHRRVPESSCARVRWTAERIHCDTSKPEGETTRVAETAEVEGESTGSRATKARCCPSKQEEGKGETKETVGMSTCALQPG